MLSMNLSLMCNARQTQAQKTDCPQGVDSSLGLDGNYSCLASWLATCCDNLVWSCHCHCSTKSMQLMKPRDIQRSSLDGICHPISRLQTLLWAWSSTLWIPLLPPLPSSISRPFPYFRPCIISVLDPGSLACLLENHPGSLQDQHAVSLLGLQWVSGYSISLPPDNSPCPHLHHCPEN